MSQAPTSNTDTSKTTEVTDPRINNLTQNYPNYYGQLQHTTTLEERDAEHVDANTVLPEDLADNLGHDLYTHQAEALDILKDGENACIATSTSSGKTLIYALYFALLKKENPDATGLLLYPTKALSRDQQLSLNNLYGKLGVDVSVQVYDGDTPSDRRKRIRKDADIIISNFSGINTYLGTHAVWDQFYSNLELMAIDESHMYTGVHGMHVAWTIRRLRRVLDSYGSHPQFVLTSATINNPAEHSQQLTGETISVVDTDGSPKGKRNILFWEPPQQDPEEHDHPTQKPADQEASELLAHLTSTDLQTMMFTRSRKQTELNAQRTKKAISDHPSKSRPSIDSYNAGHGKKSRRGTENNLKSGELDGVITTSALELGIDIGGIDATILSGYPGTRQSFWQQLGRAGRGAGEALGVFVSQQDSIDQYILNNPDYLLGDNIENAVVNIENNHVFAKHLLCASEELPLTHDDKEWFDPYRMKEAIQMWTKGGYMVGTLTGGVQYDGPPRPQSKISMYATTDEQFDIRCENTDVDMEPIGKERAYRDYHEGAIVLHKGEQYEVTELNEDNPQPYVTIKQVSVDYYTQSISDTRITDLTVKEKTPITDNISLKFGTGTVNIEHKKYKQKKFNDNGSNSVTVPIDLPPLKMNTQLMWVEIDEEYIDSLEEHYSDTKGNTKDALLGGLHAVEHGSIAMAPLELRMDKQDLGGLSQLNHPELDYNGAYFIYDGIDGGVGFSRAIYEQYEKIGELTQNMIDECTCNGTSGCPACVMEDSCGSGNEPLDTEIASDLLKTVNKNL